MLDGSLNVVSMGRGFFWLEEDELFPMIELALDKRLNAVWGKCVTNWSLYIEKQRMQEAYTFTIILAC